MRLLVFGGWGQLGTELATAAEGSHELIRPRRGDADVADPAAVISAVKEAAPDAVVNAAAFHKVEACESDPASALSVNAIGAILVARAAAEAGARAVYLSTDYVFDGEKGIGYAEDDPVSPVNLYGVSKAAGERGVRLACPDSLVVRIDFDQRDELLAADPKTYYLKQHYVNYPCVLVRLARIHDDALRDLLRMAHDYVRARTKRPRRRQT